MNICIQDPTKPNSISLHEVLLKSCDSAISGGGAFAFVSCGGVQLLCEDKTFLDFVNSGRFELVVGVDEITTPKTLDKLNKLVAETSGLEVSAFLHDVKGSLFHPKFCWFRHNSGGVIIIGSSNLTISGLRKNWEAFGIYELNNEELIEIEAYWSNWREHNGERFKLLDDREVIEKAKLNLSKPRRPSDEQSEGEAEQPADVSAWEFDDVDQVLIAEIPRASNRWNQANFDKKSFKDFFGAQPGNRGHRILLRNVLKDGKFGEIETRPSISVRSQNYRFELEAAAGRDYPDSGRPIGIFIRVSARMFIYVLAMPEEDFYDEISRLLSQRWSGRADRMKRITLNVRTLKSACAGLPFWHLVAN